jgi:hypothetical protein
MLLYITTESFYLDYEDAVIWTSAVHMTHSEACYYILEISKET